jgi:hypothetical protein
MVIKILAGVFFVGAVAAVVANRIKAYKLAEMPCLYFNETEYYNGDKLDGETAVYVARDCGACGMDVFFYCPNMERMDSCNVAPDDVYTIDIEDNEVIFVKQED